MDTQPIQMAAGLMNKHLRVLSDCRQTLATALAAREFLQSEGFLA
jgi:hypothetical protein